MPLAEEGWTDGEVPRLAARRYLEPLARAGVDVIVLGCTHYPLLFAVIEAEAKALLGDARARSSTARTPSRARSPSFLESRALLRDPSLGEGSVKLLVTDLPKSFDETASRFLGSEVGRRRAGRSLSGTQPPSKRDQVAALGELLRACARAASMPWRT